MQSKTEEGGSQDDILQQSNSTKVSKQIIQEAVDYTLLEAKKAKTNTSSTKRGERVEYIYTSRTTWYQNPLILPECLIKV